jgi:hypothetical protein
VKKKRQHLVPNCYLKAWCDPTTPVGQEPYIWLHPVNSREGKRRSPKKSFTETDPYTIESTSGRRNLRVEDTLADIETKFVIIREHLERAEQISTNDHFLLCAFVAAMCSRTKPAGKQWTELFATIRGQATRHAQARGLQLHSPRLDDAVRNAKAYLVGASLNVLTPMLFSLRAGIYYAENRSAFITCDNPCVWYDPDSFKRPPALRTQGLLWPKMKILLPLSPRSLLLFGRDDDYAGYRRANEQFIGEVNRLIRFNAHQYFVTRDGHTSDLWFEPRGLPADAWEYTEDGRICMARAEHDKKMQREWNARRLREQQKEAIAPREEC